MIAGSIFGDFVSKSNIKAYEMSYDFTSFFGQYLMLKHKFLSYRPQKVLVGIEINKIFKIIMLDMTIA